VLETVKSARELGIFVELTYLIIPGQNDDRKELEDFCEWVSGIDKDIPVHFSRFHPDFRMTSIPPTPMGTMEEAHGLAKKHGLKYVYLGNIMPGDRWENTYCPECKGLLIERWGFGVRRNNLKEAKCPDCGTPLGIIM
jgi:pyruvate formate lyase activating enzyme